MLDFTGDKMYESIPAEGFCSVRLMSINTQKFKL